MSAWYLSPKSQTETLLTHMNLSGKFRGFTVCYSNIPNYIVQVTTYIAEKMVRGLTSVKAVVSANRVVACT